MPRKETQSQPEQAQPETKPLDALQALVTLFTIYQLREHRGDEDE